MRDETLDEMREETLDETLDETCEETLDETCEEAHFVCSCSIRFFVTLCSFALPLN